MQTKLTGATLVFEDLKQVLKGGCRRREDKKMKKFYKSKAAWFLTPDFYLDFLNHHN